jgi:predicted DsbA family dithiol-disulfide isomerase
VLLRHVALERELEPRWRYFSLTQVNHHPKDDGWTVWGAADAEHVRGRRAFAAGEAARRQGEEAFRRFHRALLDLRHVGRLHADSPATIEEAATYAGLDRERLWRDMADPSILDALARDHTEAVERHGVFGTPTFVFPDDGGAAYVRVRPAPEGHAAVELFDELVDVVNRRPYVLEVKRPDPPGRRP